MRHTALYVYHMYTNLRHQFMIQVIGAFFNLNEGVVG